MSLDAIQKLEELAVIFADLRASNSRTYPVEVWQRAISLTSQIPIEKVCQTILVHPGYFRKKMKDFRAISGKGPDFVEIKTQNSHPADLITIDLETPAGFRAKIQGSSFCLCQVLNSLFKEVQ